MRSTDLGVQAAAAAIRSGDLTATALVDACLDRIQALDRFLARAGHIPVPVLVGILPLHSFRHAEFLHNEVPGITVPAAARARLRGAGESALRAGIEMAQALVADVRRWHAGAYLMPSFGRFEVVAEVLDALH